MARGCRVLGRRVRTPLGEVDLVCRRGDLLLVVEVKRRLAPSRYGAALDLSRRQEQRLFAAAGWLQRRHPWARRARIDLVAIDGWRVRIHRSAVTRERLRRGSAPLR